MLYYSGLLDVIMLTTSCASEIMQDSFFCLLAALFDMYCTDFIAYEYRRLIIVNIQRSLIIKFFSISSYKQILNHTFFFTRRSINRLFNRVLVV